MCQWEQTSYQWGDEDPEPDRMPYSCAVWSRSVYSECKYIRGRSMLVTVFHPHKRCSTCQARDREGQTGMSRKTGMKDSKSGGKSGGKGQGSVR